MYGIEAHIILVEALMESINSGWFPNAKLVSLCQKLVRAIFLAPKIDFASLSFLLQVFIVLIKSLILKFYLFYNLDRIEILF